MADIPAALAAAQRRYEEDLAAGRVPEGATWSSGLILVDGTPTVPRIVRGTPRRNRPR